MSQVKETDFSQDDIEAKTEQGINTKEKGDIDIIIAYHERIYDKKGQYYEKQALVGTKKPFHSYAFCFFNHYTFSAIFSPNSPLGRKIRTRMRIRKTKTSFHAAEM